MFSFSFTPYSALTTRDLWLRLRNGTLELKWPAQQSSAPGEMGGIDYYRESTDTEVMKKCLQELAAISISAPAPVLPPADVQSAAESVSTPTGGQASHTSGSRQKGRSAAEEVARAEALRRHNRLVVEWLGAAGIRPFATIRSRRSRYRLTMPISLPRPGAGGEVEQTVEQPVNIDIDEIQYDPADGASLLGRDAGPAAYQYSIGEVELLLVPQASSQHSAARRMEAVFKALAIPATPVRGKVLEYIARFRPEHYSA